MKCETSVPANALITKLSGIEFNKQEATYKNTESEKWHTKAEIAFAAKFQFVDGSFAVVKEERLCSQAFPSDLVRPSSMRHLHFHSSLGPHHLQFSSDPQELDHSQRYS